MKYILAIFIISSIFRCSIHRTDIYMNENDISVIEAKNTLLQFKDKDPEDLDKAIEILYKNEEPEHFEEWGKVDNKYYLYTKEIFKKAGIIIHKYDNKITNVEKIKKF